MKKIVVIVGFLINILNVYSQEWVWSNQLKCDGEVMPMDVISDANNNIYLTGYYTGGGLSIGELSLPDSGSWDGFICKFDNTGNVIWLNHIAGSGKDELVTLIILGNNLYVAGNFAEDVYFTATDFIVNSSPGKYDSFLARYDLDGNFQVASHVFSGNNVERIKEMLYNSNTNELVFNAQFKNEIKYQTETIADTTLVAVSSKDLIIATASLSGVIHKKTIHTSSITNSIYNNINICQEEGYFLTGDLFGNLYFPTLDTIKGNADASSDAVIVRLDANLNYMWARKGGSTQYDHVNSAVSDQSGNIYLTGQISGSNVRFDKNATEKSVIINALNEDLFVAKYNKEGNLLWVKRNGNLGKDDGYGIAQQENLVQFCGNTAGEVIFNTDTLTSSDTNDMNTGFAIYDTKGNSIGAQGIGGLLEDKGQAITFDNNRNTIITGFFNSPAMNIGDSAYTNTSGADGFIASYFYPFKATFDEYQDVTCNGGADGRLKVKTYFGVSPYIYDWSASTGTGVFLDSLGSNLSQGFYSVTITDRNSKKTTITYTIEEPAPFVITADSTNITCNNASDGILLAGATGNTAPYTYNWTGPNAIPSDSAQTGLKPGKYQLKVTDANGCIANDSVTLAQPDEITFGPVTIVTESPIFSYNGKIILNVQGGTPTYTYSWDSIGGTYTGEITDSLVGRTEGYYTAHLIDANSCLADTTILLLGESFRVSIFGTNVSCYSANNGSAIARIVSGGDHPPFAFTWLDSLGTDITPSPDSTIIDLTPGWYFVEAKDALDSISVDSILISQPDSLIISLTTDSVACYGNNTGAITLTRTGGITPVNYIWSNGKTTQSISSLVAAKYIVTTTDKNGCMAIDSAEVKQNDSLSINIIELQDISCNGYLNGGLLANVTGGAGVYSYTWDDPGLQTKQTATGLSAGTYSVIVKDSKACIKSSVIALKEPAPLILASVDTAHVTCYGANDGMIKVSMAGGTMPYNYDWDPNYPSQDSIGGIAPLPFPITLTVTDDNGCENDSFSVIIRSPESALEVSENLTAHVNNSCFDDALGSLTLLASGGWSDNYDFSIDSINWQTSATFNGLTANQYKTMVRDANACVKQINILITEADELIISEETVNNDTITITASGGTSPLQYTLDGNGTPQSSGQFVDLTNGTYFIEVDDANSCGPVRSSDLTVALTGLSESLNDIASIYPNPSNGIFKLNIEVLKDGNFNLEIYSVNGARVYEKTIFAQSNEFKTVTLDLSGNSKGIYLVKVNGLVLNTKLIIE